MGWTYRVFEQIIEDETRVSIREVYFNKPGELEEYEDKNKGKVDFALNGGAYTLEPIAPYGETLEELKEELIKMLAALNKPVYKDLTPSEVEDKDYED
jgi:hypothetical protein